MILTALTGIVALCVGLFWLSERTRTSVRVKPRAPGLASERKRLDAAISITNPRGWR